MNQNNDSSRKEFDNLWAILDDLKAVATEKLLKSMSKTIGIALRFRRAAR